MIIRCIYIYIRIVISKDNHYIFYILTIVNHIQLGIYIYVCITGMRLNYKLGLVKLVNYGE